MHVFLYNIILNFGVCVIGLLFSSVAKCKFQMLPCRNAAYS